MKDAVAGLVAEQGGADGGEMRDSTAGGIRFLRAENLIGPLFAVHAQYDDRTDGNPGRHACARRNDDGAFEAFLDGENAVVDAPQVELGLGVSGVLGEVAHFFGARHLVGRLGPLVFQKPFQLIPKTGNGRSREMSVSVARALVLAVLFGPPPGNLHTRE